MGPLGGGKICNAGQQRVSPLDRLDPETHASRHDNSLAHIDRTKGPQDLRRPARVLLVCGRRFVLTESARRGRQHSLWQTFRRTDKSETGLLEDLPETAEHRIITLAQQTQNPDCDGERPTIHRQGIEARTVHCPREDNLRTSGLTKGAKERAHLLKPVALMGMSLDPPARIGLEADHQVRTPGALTLFCDETRQTASARENGEPANLRHRAACKTADPHLKG